MRILIGSPIYQNPATLKLFLRSLERLDKSGITVHYLFVDDNDLSESRALLEQFREKYPFEVLQLLPGMRNQPQQQAYDYTHHWPEDRVWKVADYKNRLIAAALELQYDALFLVDSDLILHPGTLLKLIEAGKDIIAEVFWTRWQPEAVLLPQVWVCDEYLFYRKIPGKPLPDNLRREEEWSFIRKLQIPGIYEVGGLGACTLLSREVLASGVNFSKVPNVSFWGEDRHFCIRAAVHGFPLYVDTHYPAFHMYREEDRREAEEHFPFEQDTESLTDPVPTAGTGDPASGMETPASGVYPEREAAAVPAPAADLMQADPAVTSSPADSAVLAVYRPRITLSMTVYNEAGKKLREVLLSCRDYIDDAVIIDDGSTDGSGELCRELLEGLPLRLIRNDKASFHNEAALRKQQWAETLAVSPDWILSLDGDEMFETAFAGKVRELLARTQAEVLCFRLYDMWSEDHYREDEYWQAHRYYRPFLFKHKPGRVYTWKEQALHCGRFPDNVMSFPYEFSTYRVQHWGWYTPEIRKGKYERYNRLDPDGLYGWKEQYDSILDAEPVVLRWVETDKACSSDARKSRFFTRQDPKCTELIYPLPPEWWSRGYEYEWCKAFLKAEDVILDAACGIPHPLKFYLADHGAKVYACDRDSRILSEEAIVAEIERDIGKEAASLVPPALIQRLEKARADLINLPYGENQFDVVFCISVLEHLSSRDKQLALKELYRVLKGGGLLLLTFDYPTVDLRLINQQLLAAGFEYLEAPEFELPEEAVRTELWGGLTCFRAALRKKSLR